MRIFLVFACLALAGCTTVGSLYADAERTCGASGWDTSECHYAQRRAQLAADAPQGAAAASIRAGSALMGQRPRVYR